jgi:hypothetical protein
VPPVVPFKAAALHAVGPFRRLGLQQLAHPDDVVRLPGGRDQPEGRDVGAVVGPAGVGLCLVGRLGGAGGIRVGPIRFPLRGLPCFFSFVLLVNGVPTSSTSPGGRPPA